jgi:hypothetical protein
VKTVPPSMKRPKFHARAYLALFVFTTLLTLATVAAFSFYGHRLFKPETIDLLSGSKEVSARALRHTFGILKSLMIVACVSLAMLSLCLAQLWRLYRRIAKDADSTSAPHAP